jgi:hypothetical protein
VRGHLQSCATWHGGQVTGGWFVGSCV